MKLFDILKQQGLFSNDIKTRVKNNQISLNGEIIKTDIELDIETKNEQAIIFESGSFIASLIKENTMFGIQMKIFGFENLFDSNIKNDLTNILNQFIFIKMSKKENFLLRKNEKESK